MTNEQNGAEYPKHDHYPAAALYARIQDLENAIRAFIHDRGRHQGDHTFCCGEGRCFQCEEAYCRAETRLDAMLHESNCSHRVDALSGAPECPRPCNCLEGKRNGK